MRYIVIASIKGQEINMTITANNTNQALTIAKHQVKDRQIDGDYIEADALSIMKKDGKYHYYC